jgi:PAS domain S-box-containing protein
MGGSQKPLGADWEGELFRLLAENVKDYAIFVIGEDSRILTWTAGARRLLGYEEDEILGESADVLFTPEDRQRNAPQQEIDDARITGKGQDDRWHVRKDGSRFWSSGVMTPLRDESGRLRGFAKIMRDRTEWKLADDALREGEVRLQNLTDNLPQGAIYRAVQVRPGGPTRFTFLSAGIQKLFGFTAEEGLADSSRLYKAIHPDDVMRVRREEERASAALQQFDSVFRIHDSAGSQRWLHCRSAPHVLSEGEVVWEGVMLDVTARKVAEQNLREYEDRLHLALEAGAMGTWSWDIRTNEVHWSPQLEVIHGIPAGTFPGTFDAYQQDIHPDDRQKVLASIEEALSNDRPHHLEYRLVWPDGTVHWVEARGKLVRDEAGQPLHMIGVCTEVTERKRNEHDLQFLAEASVSLASLVDHRSTLQRIASLAVPHFADWCAVYLPDESGSLRQLAVAHAEPQKVRLAEEVHERWPPDPNAPYSIYRVFRNGDSVLVDDISPEMVRESVRDDEHFELLQTLGLKSYMCVPLSVREATIGVIAFVSAESGRKYTIADLNLAEDLGRRAAIASENARLYATLREEGRKKDEFLAMLAHELRNPLAPIRSGLDVLALLGTDGEILDAMQRQVEHMVRLVDDLLDVSRIMRGRIELRREHVELQSVITRAVETVQTMVSDRKQQLSVTLPSETIYVDADPVRISQVIGNLLNNASKYTEAEGRIDLTASVEGDEVLVSVRDTGAGIRPELLPNVFDLFTQDQQTIDRSQGGLGIGLTVVKSLMEMHGGSVTAFSSGAGKGSEFTLRLPVLADASESVNQAQQSAASTALRILVVDDNVSAAKMLSLLLTKLGGHDVVTAHDGMTALSMAESHKPDLVLLDIGLPKLDGFEVARRLRQQLQFRQTFVAALTGYGTEADRRRSLSSGFDEHLVKPPSIAVLQEMLSRVKPQTH